MAVGRQVRDFPPEYWPHEAAHDQGFLDELDALARRASSVLVTAYLRERALAGNPDDRRLLASRVVAEIVQSMETFFVLMLAIKQRSERALFDTFVEHRTSDVRELIDQIKPDIPAETLGRLLHLDDHHFSTRDFETVRHAASDVAKTLALKDGMLRTFYNKTKHGAVLVRNVPDGPDTEMVFVVARGDRTRGPEQRWDALGVPTHQGFFVLAQKIAGRIDTALEVGLTWTRSAIHGRTL